MYPSVRSIPPVDDAHDPAKRGSSRRGGRLLSQNLVALGLTSFFTDISSEMVLAIVPLFLTTSLGFSLFGFAVYEAAYQATTALFRIVGGSVADRSRAHKKTATTGYAISAVTKVGLVATWFVGGIPAVPFLLIDRVGKGLRTAPRDALISLSTAPSRLAQAFGVHRAFDTAGAMLGPIVAYLVLRSAPGAFDAVFVISAVVAVLGVAIISTFAKEANLTERIGARRPLVHQYRRVFSTKGVSKVAAATGLLSLLTVGDAFIYLAISETSELSTAHFPLLFVGTASAYLILATPFGALADRIGTPIVFLAGHAFLVAMYLVVGFSSLGTMSALACLSLLGAYYAATDGVVPAMVSRLVGRDVRATGIALITVVVAVGRMASAGLYAFLYATYDRSVAMVILAVTLAGAMFIAGRLLWGSEQLSGNSQPQDSTPIGSELSD